jgi:hypothetical protein
VVIVSTEAKQHRYGAAYAMAKAADDRLALAAAVRNCGSTGSPRSDRLDMTGSQSPEQVGRAIAALADDSDLLNLTGRTLRGGRAWAVRPAGTYGWRRSAGNGVMARTGSSS